MRPEADLLEIETRLRKLAPASDRQDGTLDEEIALLIHLGWLRACMPIRWGGDGWGSEPVGALDAFNVLRALGRANLSVARLFEGHMNAVKLVALYGGDPEQRKVAEAVEAGALLGVWGADDPHEPVRYENRGQRLSLSGKKRFASGLGLVRKAIVTVATEDGPQMLLVPTDDPDRFDHSAWAMDAMRSTQSGRYDFDGIELDSSALLGAPGDYHREPHFEGGVWRYCAAHLGAAEALYSEMLEHLVQNNRADDIDQQRRIFAAGTAIETARLWLVRAAGEVEAAGAKPEKAALSLMAREVTEDACRRVAETIERAMGIPAHIGGSFTDRMLRDLRLFLCQAAPDAKRNRAASMLIERRARPEHL